MSGAAHAEGRKRERVRGSTTIAELLQRHPGSAAKLLFAVGVPCAYCGGAIREPITRAARRHGRDPGAFLRVFQALEEGWPDEELIAAAKRKKQENG